MLLLHLQEAYFGLYGHQKTTMKQIRIKQKIHVAFNKLCKKQHDIWVLDQGESQDGWILESGSRTINSQKKKRPISSHLDLTSWSIKGLFYGF